LHFRYFKKYKNISRRGAGFAKKIIQFLSLCVSVQQTLFFVLNRYKAIHILNNQSAIIPKVQAAESPTDSLCCT